MALTRDFRETIRERAQKEPAFRRALLKEAVELMLIGDIETGKALIRNYINATLGFQELARAVDTPAPSLVRCSALRVIPRRRICLELWRNCKKNEGISFALRPIQKLVPF